MGVCEITYFRSVLLKKFILKVFEELLGIFVLAEPINFERIKGILKTILSNPQFVGLVLRNKSLEFLFMLNKFRA